MSKIGLTPEEESNLKTICEYLFFDQFSEYATYPRFEQCFQPLFNSISLSIDKVFKEISGEKKKYINYPRFVNSYLKYKNNDPKISSDLKTFFENLTKNILKQENKHVGKKKEKCFNYTTPKSCKKRQCISCLKVFTDEKGIIHGFSIEYDKIATNKMYPTKIENSLVISLDMTMGIVDDNPIKEKKVGKMQGIKEELYRDAITHIFGTISPKTKYINFLGFKCVSGKTVFVGFPEGESFLFGKFTKKFHEVRVQMTVDGIGLFKPGFIQNPRTNFYLNTEADNLTLDLLSKDTLIKDEAQLANLNDAVAIDKMITTPIVDDNHFFDDKLRDDIDGNDYKEVVNQNPREWIMKTTNTNAPQAQLSLNDALKGFNEEVEKGKTLVQQFELAAKGRKARKGAGRKKNQRADNGQLHKTKAVNKKKNKTKKWNGKTENVNPITFIKNKANFNALKEKVGKSIRDEVEKLGGFENEVGQKLINQLIPDPKRATASRDQAKSVSVVKKNKNKKIKTKNMKGEVKNVETTKNKNKSVQKNKSNIVISGDSDDTKPDNIFCSDAQNIVNTMGINNADFKETTKTRMRSTLYEDVDERTSLLNCQSNWKKMTKEIKKISGIFLLQTMGCVLKAIRILDDDISGKKTISLAERMELFKLLEENEKIVDFLSQETDDDKTDNNNTSTSSSSNEQVLVPEENPEKITSLAELESKLTSLNKLLENKDLSSEDRKKLEQLYNLCLQRKNILIENKTEAAKNEVISQNNIDVNKYLKEEEERRKKAQQEAQKKLEEESKKTQSKTTTTETSILQQPTPSRIFHKQEMYKGTQPFTDPLFKPEKSSLCPCEKNGDWILPPDALDDDVNGWKSFKWCRIEQIYDSEEYAVFEDGANVNDIVQGNISDCYFLSVLGSLCKFPELINKLFFTKTKTKEHLYGIYFYINGQWKLVLIDDFLPYLGTSFKQFAMSKSESNEIWVSLIEKAWAKVNGNYARIGCGGSPNEVFDVLTEAFSEEITIKQNQKEEIWNKISDGEKKGFLMTAGTSGSEDVEEVGLAPGHAYTVLGVHVIKNERVLRLRNPWGEGEFNGDWSDTSSKWDEKLKQEFHYYEKDDGDFFMGYKDFLKYYVTMGFAKIHPKNVTTNVKIDKSKNNKCQLIKATVNDDDTLVYFQLYGKNPRIPNKKGEYPVCALSNIILTDKNYNYIASSAGNDMHICVEQTLKKGEYYIFADANFRYNTKIMTNHGYTVTAYSDKKVNLEIVENNNTPNLLRKAMIDYCKKTQKGNMQSNGVNVYVTKSFNKQIPYKVLTFENTTNNKFKVNVGLEPKGEKSCCFYCDDVAKETDLNVVKEINAKESISVIIMYYSLSSLFNFNCAISDFEENKQNEDANYNHPVFEEEGEAIDEAGKLVQYVLDNEDDTYVLGLDNSSGKKLKLKLILEGLKVSDGPYKGQTCPVFEIDNKGRVVFNVAVTSEDDISFQFDFA